MKKMKLVLYAFFAVVLFSDYAAAQISGKGNYVALHRLFNSEIDDHLYTTDCSEKDNLLRDGSYVYEGVTGYIATRPARRTVPLYRMLLSSGEHFYTTDRKEVNDLTRDGGNTSEGIAGYVADEQSRNTVPFYRLVTGERHLYTTDEREKNRLMRISGNRLEETEGYLWTSGRNSCDSGNGGNNGSGGGRDDFPVVYSRADFRGDSKILKEDWNVNGNWNSSQNTIRAIRIPAGWYVTIYERKNYRGRSFTMSNDAVFETDNEWYDNIGSIKITKRDPR